MSESREFHAILDEASRYFDAAEKDVQNWLVDMKTRQPDDIPDTWWSSELVKNMTKATPEIRERILQKVAAMRGRPVLLERSERAVGEPQKQPERSKPKQKAAPLPHNSRKSLEEQFSNYDWPDPK